MIILRTLKIKMLNKKMKKIKGKDKNMGKLKLTRIINA